MWIFHGLKIIYIRVPKTGSSSFIHCMASKHKMETVFLKDSPFSKFPPITQTQGHFSAASTREVIDPKVWNSYEKIGFIRHPYPWVASFYNQPNTDEMFREDNRKPFPEFLENLRLTSFSSFTDSEGKMLIDKVYRLEDFSSIMDKYGCETTHIHPMPKWKDNVTEADANQHKDIIIKTFSRELEYYDDVHLPRD